LMSNSRFSNWPSARPKYQRRSSPRATLIISQPPVLHVVALHSRSNPVGSNRPVSMRKNEIYGIGFAITQYGGIFFLKRGPRVCVIPVPDRGVARRLTTAGGGRADKNRIALFSLKLRIPRG
jgi:hypothetical protein